MESTAENLVWIDLEMTGLDTERDHIIEIATVVTDPDLRIVAEGPVIAVHQPDSVLEAMDEWNRTTHGASGLLDRVRASRVSAATAEGQTIAFLEQYAQAGASPMCGNSICQDRRFLHRLMPELESWFHYRSLDVSTLKILAGMWLPAELRVFEKENQHVAQSDIQETIEELAYYRQFEQIETECAKQRRNK